MASAPNKQKQGSLKPMVEAAIDKIVAEGGSPTQSRVQEITGGSFRELSSVIREVKAERAAREASARAIPEMPNVLAEMAAETWGVAYRAADEIAALERKMHTEQIATFEKEQAEWEEVVARLEGERDEAIRQGSALSVQNAALVEQCRQLELEAAQLNGRLAEREEAALREAGRRVREEGAETVALTALPGDDGALSQSLLPFEFSHPAEACGSSPAE